MSTFRFFLVIAVLGVLFGCSGSDDSATEEVTITTSETTTTELTTTTTAAPTTTLPSTTVAGFSEAEAREIVDSAFAAFNSGDMDTWALWREGGWVTGEMGSEPVTREIQP